MRELRERELLKAEELAEKLFPKISKKVLKNAEEGVFSTNVFLGSDVPTGSFRNWTSDKDPSTINVFVETLQELFGEGFLVERGSTKVTISAIF